MIKSIKKKDIHPLSSMLYTLMMSPGACSREYTTGLLGSLKSNGTGLVLYY